MKHIYIRIILLAVWLMGYGGILTAQQPNYTLTNNESGTTKEYVARDYVSMQPGFTYTATSSSNFNAKIDPYIVETNPYSDQTITTPDANGNKYVVGETNVDMSVLPSGASFCEIPIKVPMGAGGMTPQLSIVYNSQSNDGLLGVGFSISGLSAISRMPHGIQEGTIRPVMLDNFDVFALDGNKLIPINSGLNGKNNTEYRTENNTFSKIISYADDDSGPTSFIVYTKSGLIYEYGNTSDSKFKVNNSNQVITWLLNKVTDTKGNNYTISYVQNPESGQYRVSTIDYCSGFVISFNYDSRTATATTYLNGRKSTISYLLKNIKICYQLNEVKKYELQYNIPIHSKYLLKSIQESTNSSSSADKISPITFEWFTNDDYKPTGREYDQTYYAQQFVKNDNEIYTGDFNGDGKTDFVATPKSGTYANKWGLFLANDAGTQCTYTNNGDLMDGFKTIYTGDFNGDGKTDIIQCRQVHGSSNTNYFVYYSTGTGFTYGGPAFLTETRNCKIIIGDFNGDGVSDVLAYYPGAKDYRTFTSSFSGGVVTPLEEKSIRYISVNWDRVETGDFNGDGLTDFLNLDDNGYLLLKSDGYGTVSGSTSGTWPNKKHVINLGDFNGDGKTDLLITGWNNTLWSDWVMRFSTGTSFDEVRISKRFDTYSKQIFVGDLNGDGKDDFFAVNKTGNTPDTGLAKMGLYISDGANFSYQDGNYEYSLDILSFYTGDFNGDGRVDYVNKSNASNGFSGYQLQNSITDRDRLLKNVTDSYGNSTSFTYKPLTDKAVYTPQTNATYPVSDFTAPLYVVDKMTVPDGIGGTKTSSYKYEGAKLHKQGKGFLGFSKLTTTDDKTGVSSIAFYEYDATHYAVGLKRSETRITKNGYSNFLLSEADYTNTYKSYQYRVYTYQPTSTVEKKYELGSTTPYSTVTTNYTYDDYGNVLTTEQQIGNEISIKSTNVYSDDISKWFLGRLTKTTVIKQANGQPAVTRVSAFGYDATSGMLKTETVEPGNTQFEVSKTYEHDSFGNIIQTTTTADGKTITDRSVYDSKGRYVTESYNTLNQKTSKTNDIIFGTVTSITDINGLTATKQYDPFGREKLTTGPDGSKAVTAYRWCNNDEDAPSNALWFKYVEVSGNPPVIVYYDKFKREVRKVVIGFDGKHIFTDILYNNLGQVSQQSDPYFKEDTPLWTTITYDELGRIKQKTLPDGSLIKITYAGLTITTENPLGQKNIRTTNMQGLLTESKDNNEKSITYVYDSSGNLMETHDSKGNIIKMEYDLMGNRTKLIDPELGTISSTYNAFGELTYEKDGNGNESTFEYDDLGRMTKRTEKEGVTQWNYDTKDYGKGKLASITAPNGYVQEPVYDQLGRTVKLKETIAGTEYTTTTQYDSYSRVLKTTYPSARNEKFTVWNKYNTYGYLEQVVNNETGKVYWQAIATNAKGQLTQSTYGNGMTTTRTYNDLTGMLNHITTAKETLKVQDWGYAYDAIGNLMSRTDVKRGLTETFGYDNLNRLLNVKKNNVETLSMTYDELGNILTKSDVGTYHYDSIARPHTLTSIDPCANSLLRDFDQRVTYTSFDKVSSLAQNTDSLHIYYGAAYERIYADSYQNNSITKHRAYIGKLYEQEKDFATGNIKETFYIFGGEGLVALRIEDDTSDKTEYVHKDHLGSIQCLTNDNGKLEQELSYDAWGNRRDPVTWAVYRVVQTGLLTDRGFTGHEHIDLFDLVNMDGRIYDPVIGRFLSADPIIQDIENLQSFNRYAYCINNPLSLFDPSGYSWLSDNWRSLLGAAIGIGISIATAGLLTPVGVSLSTLAIGTQVTIAVVAGAAGGFAGGVAGTLLNGGSVGDALKAGIIGGAIGAASGFLNYAAGCASFTGIGATIERAAKHAFVDVWMGGVRNAVYGGELSPIRDAIGGALSSMGNDVMGDNLPQNIVIQTTSAAILGGTISEIGGGKFANGAVTGAYSMLFNKLMHNGYSLKNKKNFQGVKGLTIEDYSTVSDKRRAGGNLKFTFTDPLIDENTKVYQLVETVYNGEYEKEWDYDSNLGNDPVYPFAYNEGNNTISFTDTSWSNRMNGDYFKATVFVNYSKGGYILKLNWGWKIVNNEPRLEYIKTSYYKNVK